MITVILAAHRCAPTFHYIYYYIYYFIVLYNKAYTYTIKKNEIHGINLHSIISYLFPFSMCFLIRWWRSVIPGPIHVVCVEISMLEINCGMTYPISSQEKARMNQSVKSIPLNLLYILSIFASQKEFERYKWVWGGNRFVKSIEFLIFFYFRL